MALNLSWCILRDAEQLHHALRSHPSARHVEIDLTSGNGSRPVCLDDNCNSAPLLVSVLDALAARRHPLTSLVVRQLTAPLPQPSAATLAYLNSCGLTELELYDDSIQRAASDGASNLLRPVRGQLSDRSLADTIRARGAAMARFASSIPSLQRLSLCCAAFSSADIASLAVLTQLESLTVVGAMECSWPSSLPACVEAAAARGPRPGLQGVSLTAASSYKALLASLPRLRRLQLPMAIAAPRGASAGRAGTNLWDSDDDDDDDDDDDAEDIDADGPDDCGSWISLTMGCSLSETNSMFCTTADTNTSLSLSGCVASMDVFPAGPATGRSTATTSTGCYDLLPFTTPDLGSVPGVNEGTAAAAPAVGVTGGGSCWPQSAAQVDPLTAALLSSPHALGGGFFDTGAGGKWQPWPVWDELLGSGWCFPPQLEELTVPLCALNGPVFRAACDVYGGATTAPPAGATTAEAEAKTLMTCGGLRALHVSCAPGYTVWEGSFLNDEVDFACLSRLASLESLHLTLELGGSGRGALRRDRLRDCLRHLRGIRGLKELRITETRQPLCFSHRKTPPGLVQGDIFTVLLNTADAAGVRAPQPGAVEPVTPRMPRPGSRGDVRQLPPPPRFGLHGGMQAPTSPFRFAAVDGGVGSPQSLSSPAPAMPAPAAAVAADADRGFVFGCGASFPPIPSGLFGTAVAYSPSPAPVNLSSPASRSGPSLDALLVWWPQLQTLVVGVQRADRSSREYGMAPRMVLLESLDELMG